MKKRIITNLPTKISGDENQIHRAAPNINNQEWDFNSQREGWELKFHSLDYPNYPHYIFNFPKYHHSNKENKLKK